MPHNKTTTIYLADLVHNYVGRGPFMFPINIGYIKSYLLKFHGEALDVQLFKYPNDLIEAVRRQPPDMLGLSNYAWNEDLDLKLIAHFKSAFPNMVTVLGGPNLNAPPIDTRIRQNEHLSVIDQSEDSLTPLFRNNPDVDFYVIRKGEPGFLNLLNRYLDSGGSLRAMKQSPIEGVAFLNGATIRGKDTPRMDLADIPSPYLSGIMDEFFREPLIPNLETDRGCPYPCTFCVWGDLEFQKMDIFPFDRIKDELHYISGKVKETNKTNILCLSNANFGIIKHDIEYAKVIKQLSVENGYPRHVTTFWAKNKPDGITEIAEILGGELVSVDASLQSTNPETLKATKRDNISQDAYKHFLSYLNKKSIDSDAELIVGLPEETRESHRGALKELFEMRAGHLINYNCRILKGSEMSLDRDLEKYGVKTKFRLIDTQFGEYDGFRAFESEEMVKCNNTMSEEDLFYFRRLHWLIQFTWNYKYYRGLLEYGLFNGVNPVDCLDRVLDNAARAPSKVRSLIRDFEKESRSEWFPSREELVRHYNEKENFDDISTGGFGKLNFKYTFRILLECPEEFDRYMSSVAKELISTENIGEDVELAIDNIIGFDKLLRIDFGDWDMSGEFEIEEERFGAFNYDVLNWKKDAYERTLHEYALTEPRVYRFYLPRTQVEALRNNIEQFKNIDANFTLRKMSEYMRVSDLFYRVDSGDGDEYQNKMSDLDTFHTKTFAQ